VLDRLSRALMLTEDEREHLFLLALGRPPEIRYHAVEGVTPRLQRVLDALELSLGLVKTSTWDIVAWNRAAATVLIDYASLAPAQRNILRLLFLNPQVRAKMPNWESDARFVVAAFRLETARAGASETAKILVDDLRRSSPEFAAMWRDNDVSSYGEGVKKIVHPIAGPLAFDYSAFAVDGRPDLGLIIYTPATAADEARVRALIKPQTAA
jgi:hypothetical protein